MHVRRLLIAPAVSALLFNMTFLAAPVATLVTASTTRLISAVGTTRMVARSSANAAVQFPEFRGEPATDQSLRATKRDVVNRSKSSQHGGGGSANPAAPADAANIDPAPGVDITFRGLNHRDQRTANGGNQFSLEPPDQGLCAGNGFVLETINDVLAVFDTAGTKLASSDLNTFLGYPAAINRTTGEQGPFVTDPSCYYDSGTNTWFHVVLTLDVEPISGNFTGTNHLDLAVATGSNPATATWTIYRIHTENDGTLGQPNHHCSFGPCFGDYPHIGADANGFYITTNEYSLFGPEFHSANIYAFSKADLAAAAGTVKMQQFDTEGLDNGNPGFTLWPASAPGGVYAAGTEYFLSSNAAEEANGDGTSNDLLVWAFTNTASLNSTPALHLSKVVLNVTPYSIPPKSDQKPGNIPLGDCLNDRTTKSPLWGKAAGCWRAFFFPKEQPKRTVVESHLDSNDTRMQQVVYANGQLWGALDTAVSVGGEVKAGIAFYTVTPSVVAGDVQATLANQGILAAEHNNLTYPAVAVTTAGAGAIAFTIVGRDYYPSAGWARIDASGVGDIHVISPGLGPSDGFTSYGAFVGFPPRTRWGDYGAAVATGGSIWLASESIEQTCTFSEYVATAFSCNGTRTAFGNWATRISKVTP
jgi:hypothetical protein